MIKRIQFATRAAGVPAGVFARSWPQAVAGAAGAPAGVRPSRIAVCLTLPELTGASPRHDGIGLTWFTDAAHLRRFEDWLGTAGGQRLAGAGPAADPGASPVIVAAEQVLRGAGWLEHRWRAGGDKLKHMAIALRAEGLTPAGFSRAWRAHAGRVRQPGAAQATVIPEEARGLAYAQNHPVPRLAGEWAYDGLNEVWFDDLAGLRTRTEWFAANLAGRGDGLVRQSWFIAARETVLA